MSDYEKLIEKYFFGEMDAKETQAFETKLEIDDVLMKLYDEFVLAKKLVEEAGRLELRAQLESIDKDLTESKSPVIPIWTKSVIRIAAIVVIALGIYHFGFNQSRTGPEIFYDQYEAYSVPSGERSSGLSGDESWLEALDLYKNEKYQAALELMNQIEDPISESQLQFYRGLCFLSLKNPEMAMQEFNQVLLSDSDYKEHAQWYLALTFLLDSELEGASELLKQIDSAGGFYANRAKKILKMRITN